ncbi:putative F-box/FBD/LRR-repeat protein At5g44950 [Rutidosis leptorrhynchoides]
MILQWGRTRIKKPKNEIQKQQQKEDEDLISKLPDEILLSRILSILPDADAYRTIILSNRWKDLQALLPNLHFVVPKCRTKKQVMDYHDFVDKTLASRGGLPIQKFFFQSSIGSSYMRAMNTLRTVVELKVEELDLTLPSNIFKVSLCWDLFKTCKTLVALTLKGFVLDVPEDGLLIPCLKILNLVSIVYFKHDRTFENLISGCPNLEELFVERNVVNDELYKIKLYSPSLKKLRLEFTSFSEWDTNFKSEIDAPQIEYLYIKNERTSFDFKKKMLCLAESHLCIDRFSQELFTSISATRTLNLDFRTMKVRTLTYPLNLCEFSRFQALNFYSYFKI